jgi:hypothetical protein
MGALARKRGRLRYFAMENRLSSTEGERAAPSPLHLARRAARHWKMVTAISVIGLCATGIAARITDQIYRSEAVLLYRQPIRQNNYGDSGADSARRVATRLQDMLLAPDRLRRVADEVRLYPELDDRHAAADEMRRKVLFQPRDGSTFLITFDAATPQLAQKVASRLAETLIADNSKQRTGEAEETRRLLDTERKRLEAEADEREKAVTAFLRLHPEAAMPREAMTDRGTDSGGADLSNLQRELDRVRGGSSAGRTGVSISDPDLVAARQRALAELLQARKELASRQENLTDAHPDLMAARAKVKQAEAIVLELRERTAPAAAPASADDSRTAGEKSASAALEAEIVRLRSSSRASGRPRINSKALRGRITDAAARAGPGAHATGEHRGSTVPGVAGGQAGEQCRGWSAGAAGSSVPTWAAAGQRSQKGGDGRCRSGADAGDRGRVPPRTFR